MVAVVCVAVCLCVSVCLGITGIAGPVSSTAGCEQQGLVVT